MKWQITKDESKDREGKCQQAVNVFCTVLGKLVYLKLAVFGHGAATSVNASRCCLDDDDDADHTAFASSPISMTGVISTSVNSKLGKTKENG